MGNILRNGHFANLPRRGTVVTLLDRQGSPRFALVKRRQGRNGKLFLTYVDGKGKTQTRLVVPNGSNIAREDKSIRFRWAYSSITEPRFPVEASTPAVSSTRKVGQVHPPEARA